MKQVLKKQLTRQERLNQTHIVRYASGDGALRYNLIDHKGNARGRPSIDQIKAYNRLKPYEGYELAQVHGEWVYIFIPQSFDPLVCKIDDYSYHLNDNGRYVFEHAGETYTMGNMSMIACYTFYIKNHAAVLLHKH